MQVKWRRELGVRKRCGVEVRCKVLQKLEIDTTVWTLRGIILIIFELTIHQLIE